MRGGRQWGRTWMFLASTPALRAKAMSFLIFLSLLALATVKSLSLDSTSSIRVTWSGATLISATSVTEISRGWMQLPCPRICKANRKSGKGSTSISLS
jgi:hypothetical protein